MAKTVKSTRAAMKINEPNDRVIIINNEYYTIDDRKSDEERTLYQKR